jgi:hypothetical protein
MLTQEQLSMTVQCDSPEDKPLDMQIAQIMERDKVPLRLRTMGVATLYSNNSDPASAINTLRDLISTGDEAADVYAFLGEAYEFSQKAVEAREAYKTAMRKSLELLITTKAGLARLESDPTVQSQLVQEANEALETLKTLVTTSDDQQSLIEELSMLLQSEEPKYLFFFQKCNCIAVDGGPGVRRPGGCSADQCT